MLGGGGQGTLVHGNGPHGLAAAIRCGGGFGDQFLALAIITFIGDLFGHGFLRCCFDGGCDDGRVRRFERCASRGLPAQAASALLMALLGNDADETER